MNTAWARMESVVRFFHEREIWALWGSLASWAPPSSCGPGLQLPPDFAPPAWGKGPGGRSALAAGVDAPSGSTALRRWTPWSGIWKIETLICRTHHSHIISVWPRVSSVWKPSLNNSCVEINHSQVIHRRNPQISSSEENSWWLWIQRTL